jgi:hypothetical protein
LGDYIIATLERQRSYDLSLNTLTRKSIHLVLFKKVQRSVNPGLTEIVVPENVVLIENIEEI